MFSHEKLKKYQKKKFEQFKKINELKISDNEAHILIKINDISEIISKNSVKYNEMLELSFIELIDRKVNYMPLDYPMVLEIQNKNLSSEEKILIRKLIKNYYSLKLAEKEMDLKQLKRKINFFLIFGIIVFAIFALLYSQTDFPIITEILSFIGSFSLWESAELKIFEQDTLNEDIIKYKHLSKIRIVFDKEIILKK